MAAALVRATNLLIKPKVCTKLTPRVLHLNRDWQPGPYPVTEEERKAAAAKYLMLPEEYEPYPRNRDGTGIEYGDYPDLPFIHHDEKDPYHPWTYLQHRVDYKEPVHINSLIMSHDMTTYNYKPQIPWSTIVLRLLGGWGLFLFLYYLGELAPVYPPMLIKHMPSNGEFYYYPEKKH